MKGTLLAGFVVSLSLSLIRQDPLILLLALSPLAPPCGGSWFRPPVVLFSGVFNGIPCGWLTPPVNE